MSTQKLPTHPTKEYVFLLGHMTLTRQRLSKYRAPYTVAKIVAIKTERGTYRVLKSVVGKQKIGWCATLEQLTELVSAYTSTPSPEVRR